MGLLMLNQMPRALMAARLHPRRSRQDRRHLRDCEARPEPRRSRPVPWSGKDRRMAHAIEWMVRGALAGRVGRLDVRDPQTARRAATRPRAPIGVRSRRSSLPRRPYFGYEHGRRRPARVVHQLATAEDTADDAAARPVGRGARRCLKLPQKRSWIRVQTRVPQVIDSPVGDRRCATPRGLSSRSVSGRNAAGADW